MEISQWMVVAVLTDIVCSFAAIHIKQASLGDVGCIGRHMRANALITASSGDVGCI